MSQAPRCRHGWPERGWRCPECLAERGRSDAIRAAMAKRFRRQDICRGLADFALVLLALALLAGLYLAAVWLIVAAP